MNAKLRSRDLPIRPVEKPSTKDMTIVSMHLVSIAQRAILSPSAVIATLQCALDLYTNNAIETGFDDKVAMECQVLGARLADAILKSGAVKPKTAIWTADAGLIGPDGERVAPMLNVPETEEGVSDASEIVGTIAVPPALREILGDDRLADPEPDEPEQQG